MLQQEPLQLARRHRPFLLEVNLISVFGRADRLVDLTDLDVDIEPLVVRIGGEKQNADLERGALGRG